MKTGEKFLPSFVNVMQLQNAKTMKLEKRSFLYVSWSVSSSTFTLIGVISANIEVMETKFISFLCAIKVTINKSDSAGN